MNRIDDEMKRSLHNIVKREVYGYAKEERL
jgi:hypothetical protein